MANEARMMFWLALTMMAPILSGCDDTDLFDLTSYETERTFSASVSASQADAVLDRLARAHGARLNHDPHPPDGARPRDYLSTILIGECMILAEGVGEGENMRLTVALDVVRGRSCGQDLRDIFEQAQRELGSAPTGSP